MPESVQDVPIRRNCMLKGKLLVIVSGILFYGFLSSCGTTQPVTGGGPVENPKEA
jgi:hypothetical protein